MFQLILAVISIALISALVLVTVNYTPGWLRSAQVVEEQLRKNLPLLESTFDVVVRAADGVTPAVAGAEADGGLSSNFSTAMVFSPTAPSGFRWVYGTHAVDSSRYSGMAYFCLKPDSGPQLTQGVWAGAGRIRSAYPPDQLFLGATCGEASNIATPSTFPADGVLTLFVAYTPGISR